MSTLQIIDHSTRVPPGLCALGIMTKAPQPGKVKTRLVPPLTPEEAAQLNICFLRDLSESISRACTEVSARGVAVFTPAESAEIYATILHPDFMAIPQRGENFGDRLIFAVEDLFRAGFASVCLINSDSPTVPASVFVTAVTELSRRPEQVVLGPAEDGGYYLIGMAWLQRRLFEDIDWSTERVFEQTRQRAEEIGSPIMKLPTGLDIDDREALMRLCSQLLKNELAPNMNAAVETQKFLSELVRKKKLMVAQ